MTTKRLSTEADMIVQDLLADGYTMDQIRDAMLDGSFLNTVAMTQDVAEEIYNYLNSITGKQLAVFFWKMWYNIDITANR